MDLIRADIDEYLRFLTRRCDEPLLLEMEAHAKEVVCRSPEV
jgi:hypothetical protein